MAIVVVDGAQIPRGDQLEQSIAVDGFKARKQIFMPGDLSQR